jgi:hypothetical protein
MLALLGCIVFSITRWKKYPKVAPVVVISLALLLVHAIVFVIVYDVVPRLFIEAARSTQDISKVIQNVYLILGLISSTTVAIPMALLLFGIFMRREAAMKSENVQA